MPKKLNDQYLVYCLYIIIGFYFLVGIFMLIRLPAGMSWDPGLCIKMAENPVKNIPFNYYAHPDPRNINKDQIDFVTWWSPGQFALPMLLQQCLGLKIIQAVKLLVILCMLLSAWGIFKLFGVFLEGDRLFGKPEPKKTAVLLLLTFIVISPFSWNNWMAYDGGGILLVAYCPWFILWLIRLKRISFLTLIALLTAGLLGFFLKTAFTCIFGGALLYMLLRHSLPAGQRPDLKKVLLNAVLLGLTFAVYIFIIRFAFLSRSINIMNSSPGYRLQPRIVAFPLVAPLLQVFSLTSVNRTYEWIVGCALALPLYYLILKSKHIALLYKYMLISFIFTCFCFFTLIYFINVDVSYELRHYTIISILLIPAIFILVAHQRLGKYILAAFLFAYFGYSTYLFLNQFSQLNTALARSGYESTPGYPSDILNQVHRLDDQNKNKGRDIFYFDSAAPQVALEVTHNRVLLEDNFVNFHFDNKARYSPILYYGRNSGEIYVVYRLAHFKADSARYLTRFEKYKNFQKIYQSKGFAILKAIPR